MRNLIFALVLCVPACGQGPNTVLIGTEGITVAAISSPTAVLVFGAGTTWNTITAPKLPLIISCSGGCVQLGNDPAQGVVKSLYAVQQATAYTVTFSNGTKKTVPALPPPPPPPSTTYNLTCTVAVPASGPLPATLPLTGCKLVKQAPIAIESSPENFHPVPYYTAVCDGACMLGDFIAHAKLAVKQ